MCVLDVGVVVCVDLSPVHLQTLDRGRLSNNSSRVGLILLLLLAVAAVCVCDRGLGQGQFNPTSTSVAHSTVSVSLQWELGNYKL